LAIMLIVLSSVSNVANSTPRTPLVILKNIIIN
jgi:hypothetical protein